MIRRIDDFIQERKYESEMTLKLFSYLGDAVLANKSDEKIRSIGRLAWHITETISEMMNHAGLKVKGFLKEEEQEYSIQKIIDSYQIASVSLIEEVVANWKDDDLDDLVEMYAEKWKKGVVLQVLIKHEAHHRGQLTILMRSIGLIVPGIYGPSQEEWLSFGMPVLK